jgi:CelD/BcsL family acetyltransferase involved in cellulose biosynthesis/GNAT superfamily N-acetyltransferase
VTVGITSPLTCRVLTDFNDLRDLSGCWDRLWASNPHREIFGKFSWANAWWEAYGRHFALATPVVFQDGVVVGILPLLASGRTLRFIAYPTSDYNDLLCSGTETVSILEAALNGLNSSTWDACELENLPANSRIVRAVPMLGSRLRNSLLLVDSMQCPTLRLSDRKQEILNNMFRKRDLKRNEARLSRLGTLSFRHLENRDEINLHVEEFFRQHIRRWALVGVRSEFYKPDGRYFLQLLMRGFDPYNELRFSVLELDMKPIAYHLGFQVGTKYISYKSSFDIDFADYTPSYVLLRNLFKYIETNPIDEFDFTIGDEAYKSRFTNHINQNVILYHFSGSPRGRALRTVYSVKQKLRKSPRLLRLMKGTQAAIFPSIEDVRSQARREEPVGAIRRLLSLARAMVFDSDKALIFSAADQPAGDTALQDITVREASLSDLADLSLLYPKAIGVKELADFQNRFKDGEKAFIAYGNGVPVHLSWVRVGTDIFSLGIGSKCRFKLVKSEAIILDGVTFPDFRRQGVFRTVLRELVKWASTDGLTAWACCAASNRACRRAFESAGFRLRHTFLHIRLFHRFQRNFIDGVAIKGDVA